MHKLLIVIFNMLACVSIHADNLYYYIETLPKTISERDYSRFGGAEDVISYVDSCKNEIILLGDPTLANIDKYTYLMIETHDLIDQYPSIFEETDSAGASKYTIKLLEVIERLYGVDSEPYSRIFADYLLYDCKDKITNRLACIIGQDAFSIDSAYRKHVRYQINRHSNFFDSAASSVFDVVNNGEEIDAHDDLLMNLLLRSLIMGVENLSIDKCYDVVRTKYTSLDDVDEFLSSSIQRQRFMDGTGMMLSLYSDDLPNAKQENCIKEIRRCVDFVERSFVHLSNPVTISRNANYIHVLAYLQAWKKFIKSTAGGVDECNKLDAIVPELYRIMPVLPVSYQIAIDKYNCDAESAITYELPDYNEKDEPLLDALCRINDTVKQNDAFSSVESYLPPIIEYRLEKLHDEKQFQCFLDYCSSCLECVDKYFDGGFTWYVDHTSEETIQASKKRKNELLAKGWTGKAGDKYVASNNILDYAIDYLVRSQGYDNKSAPNLLFQAAKNKLSLGDLSSALLYSKIADGLFTMLNKSTFDWLDNKRIYAITNYKVNGDTTAIAEVSKYIPKLEQILLSGDTNNQGLKLHHLLISLYNTLTDFELSEGNVSQADLWNNRALDYMYKREGSIWYSGGSVLLGPSADLVNVLNRGWQIAKAKGDAILASNALNRAYWQLYNYERFEGLELDMINISGEIKHEFNSCWDNRQGEKGLNKALYDSSVLRENIQQYSTAMHPKLRNNYYSQSQKSIYEFNGILANSDSISAAKCIFNNLLLFHGLQLLNERLIANAAAYDDECKAILAKYNSINNSPSSQKLVKLFRSDNYAKKFEERALTSQGLKRILSINYTNIQQNINSTDIVIEFFKAPFWHDSNYSSELNNNEIGYYAAILKKSDDPIIVQLCSATDLPQINTKVGYNTKQLTKLFNCIWKPILPYLQGVNTIYFTPDAELSCLPLEYLPLDQDTNINEVFSIVRLSSSRVLADNHEDKANINAALFGYMHYDAYGTESHTIEPDSDQTELSRSIRGSVDDLNSTKIEIYNINKILGKKKLQCTMYTEYNATEEAFKSLSGAAPNILHIATHGKYWPNFKPSENDRLLDASFLKNEYGETDFDDPLNRSVLLFSGANSTLQGRPTGSKEDEVLTAKEISSLELSNVDLLVLSACQTGLGDIQDDGVYGLQRGFKKAGVNTILMSLWKVDDDATQMLMSEFYRNYASGLTKQQSLRQAQKAVRDFHGKINGKMRDFSNPRYWAAFVLLDALN